jgi:hypothetical protein
LFSKRPWYSSTWVWNLSSRSFLDASMAFRTDDFLSSRTSKSFSKCEMASSLALSPLHYCETDRNYFILNPNASSQSSKNCTHCMMVKLSKANKTNPDTAKKKCSIWLWNFQKD